MKKIYILEKALMVFFNRYCYIRMKVSFLAYVSLNKAIKNITGKHFCCSETLTALFSLIQRIMNGVIFFTENIEQFNILLVVKILQCLINS